MPNKSHKYHCSPCRGTIVYFALCAGLNVFIGLLLPSFDKILKGGLITTEYITIVLHKPGRGKQ